MTRCEGCGHSIDSHLADGCRVVELSDRSGDLVPERCGCQEWTVEIDEPGAVGGRKG